MMSLVRSKYAEGAVYNYGRWAERLRMSTPADDVTVTVCETVADALATPIEELPPLSNAIDLEGLSAIVTSKTAVRPPGVTVTFEYAGLEVVVHSDGIVYARPITPVSATQ